MMKEMGGKRERWDVEPDVGKPVVDNYLCQQGEG